MSSHGENLTLTEADLAACCPLVAEGGHVLRALCPFHGSDRQRSLRVQLHSGRFVCFACGAWGYLEASRQRWCEEGQRQAAFPRPAARRQQAQSRRPAAAAVKPPAPRPLAPREPTPARPDLAQQLTAFQAALPGSRGAAYLQQRGMPLALAQQLGVGSAAPGTWPHAARDWRGGAPRRATPDGPRDVQRSQACSQGRAARTERPWDATGGEAPPSGGLPQQAASTRAVDGDSAWRS